MFIPDRRESGVFPFHLIPNMQAILLLAACRLSESDRLLARTNAAMRCFASLLMSGAALIERNDLVARTNCVRTRAGR